VFEGVESGNNTTVEKLHEEALQYLTSPHITESEGSLPRSLCQQLLQVRHIVRPDTTAGRADFVAT